MLVKLHSIYNTSKTKSCTARAGGNGVAIKVSFSVPFRSVPFPFSFCSRAIMGAAIPVLGGRKASIDASRLPSSSF